MGVDPYPWIKLLHIACAALSISGFIARSLLKLYRPQSLRQRWLRIAPHINDTALLAAALYLSLRSGQYPGSDPWLTAKLIGLIFYILLGMSVMRFARTRRRQVLALVGALICFGYVVAVAVTRSVLPLG